MGYEMDVLETPLVKNKNAHPAALTLMQLLGLAPVAQPFIKDN